MKKKGKVVLAISLTLILIFGAAACGGNNSNKGKEVIKLSVGAGHSETAMPYVKAVNEYFMTEVADRVNSETNYSIEWTPAWSGSVAKLAEMLNAVQEDLLDVGAVCVAFVSDKLFPHSIGYYLPLNSDDAKIVQEATLNLYKEYPEVFTNIFEEKYNQKFLGLGCVGNYQLITNFEVKNLSDLKGHQIAVAGLNKYWVDGSGATPVQSDLTEAYQSIQTGVYDGWVMYAGSAAGYKLHEVAPYWTEIGYGATSLATLTMNLDKWNSLPKEVQQIMEEVGAQYSIESGAVANTLDEENLQTMIDEGLNVTSLTQDQRAEYAETLDNIPQLYVDEMNDEGYDGKEIMTKYIELLSEAGYDQPRDWANELK